MSTLTFDTSTPVAPHGLGGLPRDLFGHGRLFATVSAHGGLTRVSYWNRQRLKAAEFLHGDPESSWVKCFRIYAELDGERHYLTLRDTALYPFGYTSQCRVGHMALQHECLLLPDAIVQRFKVLANPDGVRVRIAALHQEFATATQLPGRTWSDLTFDRTLNALIASCTDTGLAGKVSDGSLAQRGCRLPVQDGIDCTTWIGIGCTETISYHRGYHPRSKHYLSAPVRQNGDGAFFLVFASSRAALGKRLRVLSRRIHAECDAVLHRYETAMRERPQIETGNRVLDSAFAQYPACIEAMKLPDRPGAIKATLAHYFVWGWDGLTAPMAFDLANDPLSAAETLRFYQQTLNRTVGIPHAFTTRFGVKMKGPFPSQALFILGLYHYVCTTGDMALVRELLPTCRFILDRCRRDRVKGTGLVRAYALWPDFPEAMEENGHDISSMNNSLLYQGLRAMEYLAWAIGKKNLAAECHQWAATLRKNFVHYLYDADRGFFISSCDSQTFRPRKHYCPQSIFWVTPFAWELVSHAPQRISRFMEKHLRFDKCLLTLPHWDSAWMADGNQLGSTFPAADAFYLHLNKLVGHAPALDAWIDDVTWFWKKHTAPEAYTPEALNEADMGIDNPGCKQLQALTTWYAGAFGGIAGIDLDHEGITLTPWSDKTVTVRRLKLRGTHVDLHIRGKGNHIGKLLINGKPLTGCRKIGWSQLAGKHASIELIRSQRPSLHPSIIRADGLSVEIRSCRKGYLLARASGHIHGEVLVAASPKAKITLNSEPYRSAYCKDLGVFTIPCDPDCDCEILVEDRL